MDVVFRFGVFAWCETKFADDVSETAVVPVFTGHVKMGPTAVSETSSANSRRTPGERNQHQKNNKES